jgi:hypothetical protein
MAILSSETDSGANNQANEPTCSSSDVNVFLKERRSRIETPEASSKAKTE